MPGGNWAHSILGFLDDHSQVNLAFAHKPFETDVNIQNDEDLKMMWYLAKNMTTAKPNYGVVTLEKPGKISVASIPYENAMRLRRLCVEYGFIRVPTAMVSMDTIMLVPGPYDPTVLYFILLPPDRMYGMTISAAVAGENLMSPYNRFITVRADAVTYDEDEAEANGLVCGRTMRELLNKLLIKLPIQSWFMRYGDVNLSGRPPEENESESYEALMGWKRLVADKPIVVKINVPPPENNDAVNEAGALPF